MACIAICRTGRGDMEAWLACRNCAVMACCTCAGNSHPLIVFPGRWPPCCSLGRMAGHAIGCSRYMVGGLAHTAATARTVAGETVRGGIEGRVAWHRTRPARRGVVATLAIASDRRMDRSTGPGKWFGGHCVRTAARILVAGYALGRHTDVGVQLARVPAGVPTLMARITVAGTCQSDVRYVR